MLRKDVYSIFARLHWAHKATLRYRTLLGDTVLAPLLVDIAIVLSLVGVLTVVALTLVYGAG
jgi:hypothetical protein